MEQTAGERLKQARKARGMTQASLAQAAGLAQSAVGNIEAGIRGFGASVVVMAEILRVNARWLSTGEGPMEPSTANITLPGFTATSTASNQVKAFMGRAGRAIELIDLENNPDYPAIRRVNFKLSAGVSGFAIDYDHEDHVPIVFNRQWYESRGLRPDRLFAVKVANGSMEPGLHHGDTVVVNTEATQPTDGVVFAVNYEGELCIKRLVRDEGAWWLSSDNPNKAAYPRKRMTEDCFIIGTIVHKQSEWI